MKQYLATIKGKVILKVKSILTTSIVLVLLTGCNSANLVNGNSDSVTYNGVVLDGDLSDAYKKAEIHCKKYNKSAEHTLLEKYYATFLCVK